jgi:hypothetical protein
MSDFKIENHGSIYICRPLNEDALHHLQDNLHEDSQWFGGGLAVEPRYVYNLAQDLTANGWRVE